MRCLPGNDHVGGLPAAKGDRVAPGSTFGICDAITTGEPLISICPLSVGLAIMIGRPIPSAILPSDDFERMTIGRLIPARAAASVAVPRHLERHDAAVTDDLGTDLDQLFLERRQ